MSDDLRRRLHVAAESLPAARGDAREVVRAGRRTLRARRWATCVVVALVAALAWSVAPVAGERGGPALPADGGRDGATRGDALGRDPGPPLRDGVRVTRNGVVEPIDERQAAEIFAFRALAHTGLMEPLATRTYNFTYDDDTIRTDDGWRVGFAASDCAPRGSSQTCTPLSGEHHEDGNARADSHLTVRLEDDRWTVVAFDGNVPPADRARVVGYTLPQRDEPSHWEYPAVGTASLADEVVIEGFALWVGPYPSGARGSVCELTVVGSDGTASTRPFYDERPDREFERAGGAIMFDWSRGDVADAAIECRQDTGPAWEVASEPELLGEPGAAAGVSAELVWRGDEGFTSAAVCRATLVDAGGDVVWEGQRRVLPLWRPDELDDYPYRTEVGVYPRGPQPIDAVAVGEFSCESR
ncbi:MAG TPA: hypothetical protein VHJ34_05825 [Actinomycetota bacterium]|nr:hypothetical protein [Actinomycetota bacterium]